MQKIPFDITSKEDLSLTAWNAPMQEMTVPPAKKRSIEERLYEEKKGNRLLLFEKPETNELYTSYRPQCAIGLVCHPQREMVANYVSSLLASRYDALIYIDKRHALHPFHIEPDGHKLPEMYPFGI